MIIELASMSKNQVYHTITQTLVPRPIAWVLSQHTKGHFNLAPFSYFTAVSSKPPLLMFSVDEKSPGELKDTAANIQASPYFVVHIASAEQAEAVTETSRTLPATESELANIDMPTVPFDGFPLPRLGDAPVAYGCKRHSTYALPGSSQILVFGEVERIYIADHCAERIEFTDKQGRERTRIQVSAETINPLSRLGGGEYGTLGPIKSVPRPR